MSNFSSNNKRIAKNTLLLYFRQLLIMVVSLYTSRVVLQTLGVTDFGIFNVVGGMVTMFSFLMSTMASASQRYLSYDMASGNDEKLRQTFGLVMLTYILLIVITVILIEVTAVWFLNNKMTIPPERLGAANWVLQFAVLTFVAQILATPYLSVVIAREKMEVYAYVSILDVVLKLLIVYLLVVFSYDKLLFYSFLMFLSSLLITIIYMLYCRRNFMESRCNYFYEKSRLKEMLGFAWWNMIGTLSNLFRSQGINILLNMFFNPAVNAARGIAYQVNSAITGFANNFYTAVRPQIIKTHALREDERMRSLISYSSRLAFYLMFILSLPIIIHAKPLLALWLGNPPEYASLFVQLILVNALLEVFSMPLTTGLQATGNIKSYQLIVSGIYLLNIPVSYVLLKLGMPPESPMYVNIALVLVGVIPRLLLCRKYYLLSIRQYTKEVLLRAALVAISCYLICQYVVVQLFDTSSVLPLLTNVVIMGIASVVVVYILGLTHTDRQRVNILAMQVIHKIRRKSN